MSEEGPLLDWAHLEAQTGGEASLQREVLTLFLKQAEGYLETLAAHPDDSAVWREYGHKLIGAARAVGAHKLARLARRAETSASAEREALVDAMRTGLTAVRAEIERGLSEN